MDAETYRPQIQASVNEGNRRGVGATPTFIFNNATMVPQALPYDAFSKMVDSAIAKLPKRADSTATPAAAPAKAGATKRATP